LILNYIFLTFGHVHLRLCVQYLFSPVPFCFHLELKLALSVESLACWFFSAQKKNSPPLSGWLVGMSEPQIGNTLRPNSSIKQVTKQFKNEAEETIYHGRASNNRVEPLV
jgi:hypothetical protein